MVPFGDFCLDGAGEAGVWTSSCPFGLSFVIKIINGPKTIGSLPLTGDAVTFTVATAELGPYPVVKHHA